MSVRNLSPLLVFAVWTSLVWTTTAHAQTPASGASGSAAVAPVSAPVAATETAAVDKACAGVARALARGVRAEASRALVDLRGQHPQARCGLSHALVARLLGVDEGAAVGADARSPQQQAAEARRLSRATRFEFTAFAGLDGVFAGVMFDLIAQPDSGAAVFLIPAALGIAGPVIAWNATADQTMSSGTVAGVRTGAWLATAHSVILANALNSDWTLEGWGAWMLLNNALGAVAGGLIGHHAQTTDGQAAMVASGAMWGAAAVTLFGQAASSGGLEDPFDWMLAGMDLGMLGAAVGASFHPMSRGRVALIDAGGLAGGLVGLAVPVLIQGDKVSSRVVSLSTACGLGFGLAAAVMLTEDTPLKDAPGGRFGSLTLRAPSPTLLASPAASDRLVPGVALLQGSW